MVPTTSPSLRADRARGVLDRVARIVTHRRRAVFGAILLVTVVSAAALPALEADPSPERLMMGTGDHGRARERLRAHFGDTDRVVLVLVSADDVLERQPLSYMHRISRRLATLPGVEHVDGLTVTPVPRHGEAPRDTLTLDDLEGELDDDLSPTYVPPETLEAMAAIAAADPARFPDGLASIADGAARIIDGPIVEGDTVSAAEVRALVDALGDAPLVNGRLVSRDRRVAVIAVRLARDAAGHRALDAQVKQVDAALAAHPPPAGVELTVGGLPHLRTAIVDQMVDDQTILVPVTLAVCMVLLLLASRWVVGSLLPLLAVCITGLFVMGGMALVGQPLDILNNVVPALLIGIGVSDAIHLLSRYREELEGDPDRLEAARRTVRRMALACLLTSVTTSVGFASLVVAQTQMLRRFGVIAALGVMAAYVVTLTFVPAAMTAFAPPASREPGTPSPVERAVLAITRLVLRRPWWTLAATAALMAACTASATRVTVGSRLVDNFDEQDEVWRAAHILDTQLDGFRPLEVLLTSASGHRFEDPAVLGGVDRVARWLETQPGVRRVTTAADLLHETWFLLSGDPAARERPFVSREQVAALSTLMSRGSHAPLRTYLSNDGTVLRVEARLEDMGAARTLALVEALETRLALELAAAGAEDVEVTMTGEAFVESRGNGVVMRDLLGSLLTAVALICAILLVLFRSARLGLVSVPPSVIPLMVTLAWMALRGICLDIATAITFSIGLGLAVDGTIHVLVRFREESRRVGETVDDALLRSARGTGAAFTISSVTLAAGFGVMLLSGFVPVRRFGELIAITVVSCLASTLMVLPALLKVTHRSTHPRAAGRPRTEGLDVARPHSQRPDSRATAARSTTT